MVKLRKSHQPQPISGIINQVMLSMGITKNYNGWTVVNNWQKIVGKMIAKEAKAVCFEDGCLIVAVDDSVWRQELAMKKESLLKKIQSYPYGNSVKRIQLVRGRKGK
ncbi:MAG: DUF721 domain-containing protein [Candidatus Zixiibacteriota bacterium]